MVDVLLATYNGEKYLDEQLNSLINQTFKDINIFISDDNSTDKTINIIKRYMEIDPRIKLMVINKKKLGFVGNFEKLLKYSKADYLMLSDQDDIWFLDKIEKMYKRMKEVENNKQQPVLLHTNSMLMYKKMKTNKLFIDRIAMSNKFESFFFNYFVQGSTCMLNKKLKEEALPFSKEVYLHDRYLHILAELLGKRVFINKALTYYRQHEENQIGASVNYIEKILKKTYYEEKDRDLIFYLNNKLKKRIEIKKMNSLKNYFIVTNKKITRLKRLYLILKYKIPIKVKKIIFLLLKG